MKNILRELRDEIREDRGTRKFTYIGVGLLVAVIAGAAYFGLKYSNETLRQQPSQLEIKIDLDDDGTKETTLKPGIDYLLRVDNHGRITVQEYRR